MKIIFIYVAAVFLGLTLAAVPSFAASTSGGACPVVDCDCEFIAFDKWHKLCVAREAFIKKECVSNSGKPKGYCGLHGPAAFPVATTIQYKKRPSIDPKLNLKSLSKSIGTQMWSLADDFNVLKAKEKRGSVVDAIRIAGLFRKNSQQLFDEQQKVVLGYLAKRKESASIKASRKFSKPVLKLAKELSMYGDELWQKTFSLEDGNRKKAYKTLAFKISRESANVYERAASLFASGRQYRDSANTWQKASLISKKLLKWETSTSNKAKYVAYYKKQASARLHRATLYWIMADNLKRATANIESSREGFSTEEEQVLIGLEPRALQAQQR